MKTINSNLMSSSINYCLPLKCKPIPGNLLLLSIKVHFYEVLFGRHLSDHLFHTKFVSWQLIFKIVIDKAIFQPQSVHSKILLLHVDIINICSFLKCHHHHQEEFGLCRNQGITGYPRLMLYTGWQCFLIIPFQD